MSLLFVVLTSDPLGVTGSDLTLDFFPFLLVDSEVLNGFFLITEDSEHDCDDSEFCFINALALFEVFEDSSVFAHVTVTTGLFVSAAEEDLVVVDRLLFAGELVETVVSDLTMKASKPRAANCASCCLRILMYWSSRDKVSP